MTIKVTLTSQTADDGQTIAGRSFISSVSDLNGRAITEYAFFDNGADGGYFTLNGVKEADGKWFYLTAAQLASLEYVAGANAGSETISVEAYDGAQWSASYSTTETTVVPPPTVIAASQTLYEGQSVAASSLIASTSVPKGKTITEYAVMDSGTDGHLVYNGVTLTAGTWYDFTAAQLAEVTYVAGSGTGTDKVSIEVSDGGAFSAASVATITVTTPPSVVSRLKDPGIAADVSKLMVNNSLSYNAMLTILQDAAVGGMTATKFSTLQTLASMFNQPNGVTVSSYVQQIADDVIGGNSANAYWNGGSSTAVALGNLSAASTQTQVNELIGKWFLGTDLPSLSVSAIGEANYNPTYQADTQPLFGASGTPNYLDVNQGYLGDCYFVSSLAETALQDPSVIESMITSDGNGVYSVRFYVDGQADYVTVNDELPVMGDGYQWANGSTLEFANGSVSWAALIEKGFVELNEQTAAAQAGGHTTGDAYEDINGGTAYALTEITDQSFNTYALSSKTTTASLSSLMSTLGADWKAGDEIILSTPNNAAGNLVADHMFEVTGVNASAGTITLQNPWNTAYSGSIAMTFTDTIKQLASAGCTLYATTGTAVA
ncbi:MAG: C2 family cysteine protease [Roseiarcus sp.]